MLWLVLLGLGLGTAGAHAAQDSKQAGAVTVAPLEGKVRVELGGQLFTEYLYQDTPKPVLYPVLGPGGVALTRNYPMKKDVAGEVSDHPHHRSLWFCHGDVNGINFWAETPPFGKIVQDKLEAATVEGGVGVIRTHDRWVGPDGKTVLTDARATAFRALPGGSRAIDFEITLIASAGDVTFRDTKEGSMAIRTHAGLSLESKKGKATGQAVNSEGVRGKAIWGKHANWVDYWGTVDGHPVGVAIFDHPANPRHPTTWHAREYGLIAVNPFGLHDFEGKPKGTGDMVIKKGERVTFRYRFLFHEGDVKQGRVEEAWKEYAAEK
jgi:hypothetical protein